MTVVIFLLISYFIEVVFSIQLHIKSAGFNHISNPFLAGVTSTPHRPKRYTRWGGDIKANSEFLVQILDDDYGEGPPNPSEDSVTLSTIPCANRLGKIQLGSVQMPAILAKTTASRTQDPLKYTRFVPLKERKDKIDTTFHRLLLQRPLKSNKKGYNKNIHPNVKSSTSNPQLAQDRTLFADPNLSTSRDWNSILTITLNPDESEEDVDITINVKDRPSDVEEGVEDVNINALVPSSGRNKTFTAADAQHSTTTECLTSKTKTRIIEPNPEQINTKTHNIKATTKHTTKRPAKCSKKPVNNFDSIYVDGSDDSEISEQSDNVELDVCENNNNIGASAVKNIESDGRTNSESDGRANSETDGSENSGSDVHKKPPISNQGDIYEYINEETTKKHSFDTHTIVQNFRNTTISGHDGGDENEINKSNEETNSIQDEMKPFTFASHHKLPEIMLQLKQWCGGSQLAKCVDITNGSMTYLKNPVLMTIVDDRSYGQDSSAKQTVLIVAGIQGRDHDAVSGAMYLLYELIERSEHHADLLELFRFWIVPVLNPDGYEYSTSFSDTRYWAKNMKQSWQACKDNNARVCGLDKCMGVNLDRNFEYQWTAGDGRYVSVMVNCKPDSCRQRFRRSDPCSDLYPGERQLTEPETIALTSYLNRSRAPPHAFIAIKEGDILGILYPYSHTQNRRITDAIHRRRANRAGYAAHSIAGRVYVSGQASEFLPMYAGGIEDWMEGHLGVDNSYTVMLGRLNDTENITIEQVCHEGFAAIDTLLLTVDPEVSRHQRMPSAARGAPHSWPWLTYKPLNSFTALLRILLYYLQFRLLCTVLFWLRNFETIP